MTPSKESNVLKRFGTSMEREREKDCVDLPPALHRANHLAEKMKHSMQSINKNTFTRPSILLPFALTSVAPIKSSLGAAGSDAMVKSAVVSQSRLSSVSSCFLCSILKMRAAGGGPGAAARTFKLAAVASHRKST
eukprot:scaffold39179_cov50-Attheya_sp.AAC.6